MFYEVKILDKNGSVKKVISSKSLSNKFWKRNKQGQEFTGSLNIEDGELDYSNSWNSGGGVTEKSVTSISETLD